MTTNQNVEEVRVQAIQDAETMIAVYGKSEVFAPFCGVMRRLIADLAALQTEAERLRAANAEQFAMLEESVRLGSEQAAEYDRFWEAMGVCSEDITVDDAIAKYKALQTELHDVRRAVVDQCDLTGDYSYNDGNMIVWVSCVCCNEDWQHNEQPKHKEGCVYERCRQALAAEGGEGA